MALPSLLDIETAALTAWPGLYTAYDGHWVWRAARGYSNRANSIQCLDPNDGHDASLRLARFSDMFIRHGLKPVFKTSPLTAPEITHSLDALQWQVFGASHVLRMEIGTRGWTPRHHTALFAPADPDWHRAQAEMSCYGDYDRESVRLIIERIACDTRGVLAYDANGVPAAAALAGVSGGVAIFGNVVSRPSHRGQGFGRAVMEAALNWSRDAGATAAGIQVAAENATAIKLYTSLGFGDGYDYHYRRPRSG
jgi:GNAT superfamily N-acetyltransferase